jgi:hypothetical protein
LLHRFFAYFWGKIGGAKSDFPGFMRAVGKLQFAKNRKKGVVLLHFEKLLHHIFFAGFPVFLSEGRENQVNP